jgi:hypothetical protein
VLCVSAVVVAGAGGGSTSGGGGGSSIAAAPSVSEIRETVVSAVQEGMRARVVEVTISGASAAEMNRLLEDAGGVADPVTGSVPEIPDDFLPQVTAFSWEGGEDANTAAACTRLSEYLSSGGAPMAPGANPGFKVLDIHRFNYLTTQICNVKLKCRTDAVILPSASFDGLPLFQARVIVDFKKPDAADFQTVVGQAIAELLASSSLSRHDLLVVFTDLGAHNHILRGLGDKLIVWKNLDIRSMIFIVSQFLSTECARVGVHDMDDPLIPGSEAHKVRRKEFMKSVHDARPPTGALLEQLAAFDGGSIQDFFDAREVLYSWLPDEEPFPSYYS